MGSVARAHLAYGYDLGTADEARFAEVDEYGAPALPWFDDEETDEDEGDRGFVEQLFNHLYSLIPDPKPAEYDFERQEAAEEHFGITVEFPGHVDNSGLVLAVANTDRFVSWAETLELDSAEISRLRPEWDTKLTIVLAALGITPTQDSPKWLVFPSYG